MDTASVEAAIRVSPSTAVACAGAASSSRSCPTRRGSQIAATRGDRHRGTGPGRDAARAPRPPLLPHGRRRPGGRVARSRRRVAGISIFSPIALVFDQPLDVESVDDEMLTIEPAVAGSLTWSRRRAPRGCAMPSRESCGSSLRARSTRTRPTTSRCGRPARRRWGGHARRALLDLHHRGPDRDPLEPGRLPLGPGGDREPLGDEPRRLEPAPALDRAVPGDELFGYARWTGVHRRRRRRDRLAAGRRHRPSGPDRSRGRRVRRRLLAGWITHHLWSGRSGARLRPRPLAARRRRQRPAADRAARRGRPPSRRAGAPRRCRCSAPPACRRTGPRSPSSTRREGRDPRSRARQLTSAAFVALSEPIWLPDGSGILVAGLRGGTGIKRYQPHSRGGRPRPRIGLPRRGQLAAVRSC